MYISVFARNLVGTNFGWVSGGLFAIENVLAVISCNWALGEAGNCSKQILEKGPTYSEARKTSFGTFSGQTFVRTC